MSKSAMREPPHSQPIVMGLGNSRTCGENGKLVDPLPNGFVILTVRLELTEKEFRQLKFDKAASGPGTWSAAVRLNMGLAARPYGLLTALRRLGRARRLRA